MVRPHSASYAARASALAAHSMLQEMRTMHSAPAVRDVGVVSTPTPTPAPVTPGR
jgi:hypothetical protein